MCPPAASTPIDIDFAASDEESVRSLDRVMRGSGLPSNVFDDVNPYNFMPADLPELVWYFVPSKEKTSSQHGRWKAKGDACEIFSNSDFIGWKTTLEFYQGPLPCECKTDWIMQKFSITQKKSSEDGKDSSSLCRVFLSDRQSLNHDKQLSMSSSTSKPQVNDDNRTRASAVMDRPTNHHENLPEIDGDYLELWDLDSPLSPSSISDNSSCMTMSSDEYFDSDALLQDLEAKNTNVGPENAGYKYTVSTLHRSDEVVMLPGSPTSVERSKPETEEILKTKYSMHGTSMMNRELDSKALKQTDQGRKADYRDEGPSSNAHNLTLSSHGHRDLQNGENKASVGRMKKLKRCFMPF